MEQVAKELRKQALYLSHKCMDGNLQSVFSCIDIVWTLYDRVMNWNPNDPMNDDRDFFIISKGQATLALYPVLIKKGFFDVNEIANEIGTFNSRYCIQTDMTKFMGGIENNAGSLGHGLPFATGIAYANKIKKSPSKVFVLCGDGEFCEGSMWESCIFAAGKHLDNLCLIIDDNDSVGTMIDLSDMSGRLSAFRFDVCSVNGHNPEELYSAFSKFQTLEDGRPKAIIARTIRGYGSATMTENDIWFHKAPNEHELEMLIKEVDEF